MNLNTQKINENNLKILFWLRNKPSRKTGLLPIYCRITLNGERASAHGFSTGIYIDADVWNSKIQRIMADDEQSEIWNDQLTRMKLDIQRIFANYDLVGEPFQAKALQDTYLAKPTKNPKRTLRELAEQWEVRFKKYVNLEENAPRTFDAYKNHIQKIIDFFGGEKDICSFTASNWEDFRLYLSNTIVMRGKTKGERLHINTVAKHLTTLRALITFANELGWLKDNPFRTQTASKIDPEIVFLPYDKLLELQKLQVQGEDEIARDIFVFLAYTGISYKDYCFLTSENIEVHDNKEFIHISFRRKSPKMKKYGESFVPILPEAKAMIDKYGGLGDLPKQDDCNRKLKYLWGRIDVRRDMSLKNARQTFVNYARDILGLPDTTIALMVGHNSVKTTRKSYLSSGLTTILHDLKRASL